MEQLVIVAAAGLLAGAINALAGGGSFITFPALVFMGMPPIAANQTSSVSLMPGGLASAWAYRREIRSFRQVNFYVMALPTVAGGGIGAILLLLTPSNVFDLVIPWLVLLGALTFAFGKRVQQAIGSGGGPITPVVIVGYQLVLGAYGGYFGGAVGIMMMAGWSLFGLTDIQAMNGMKTLMVAGARLAAVVIFIFLGHVYGLIAIVMMIAAIIGGYLGGLLARRVSAQTLRSVIAAMFFLVTAAFFYRGYK